ncbi:DUF3267 domain-containing protein [Helcococcus kunzii]
MSMDRKLSKQEEKRLEEFNKIKEDLISKGYEENFLTIGIIKANVFAIIFMIPFWILFSYWFKVHNNVDKSLLSMSSGSFFLDNLLFLGLCLVLIVLHELTHGVTWAMFSKNGFKDISFGIIWKWITPYCTCKTPLKKSEYIVGALTPLLFTGLLPAILGVYLNSFILTIVGVFLIGGAAGDIMMVYKLLKYKAKSNDTLIYDHPTEVGSIIFER